ncbi:MAG TPA: SpoIIE family protein phosphatase [Bacteroidales bacterium]|nr:SpoIIE family protein phosphatase [Bacteroidales bacterium]
MYIHTDVFVAQSAKKPGDPCGDAWGVHRDVLATTIVLADGLGSGIKAHVAATMCVARLIEHIRSGSTIREAFDAVSATMDKAWGSGEPFAVFTIARMLNNGQATVLCYETPSPLLVARAFTQLPEYRKYMRNKAMVHEAVCKVDKDEGLLLVSDGVTQAGIGKYFPEGWEIAGIRRYVQGMLPVERIDGQQMANRIHQQARQYWSTGKGDDITVLFALNRRGVEVNLLSGPPADKAKDEQVVRQFEESQGIHIICGGSTAKMVARVTGQHIEIAPTESAITPPSYLIAGFELVTEGMVTLNQAFHLLDEPMEKYPEGSPASDLAYFLKMADKVNIWLGHAENLGDDNIEFRQQGLYLRPKIIRAIQEKLIQQGKLVVLHNC